MEKIKINLDILLPDIPDEKDACVQRIIDELQGRQGIDAVHIVEPDDTSGARLCFHYNPAVITVEKVQALARQAGAKITDRFHHLLVEVEGIRHQRQTRPVEMALKRTRGILAVSASGSGMIMIEYDRQIIGADRVRQLIGAEGLNILSVEDAHRNGKPEPAYDHPHKHDHPHEHQHGHSGAFGKHSELIFSILCGMLLAVGFGIGFISGLPGWIPVALYATAYFFGGYYTAGEAWHAIRHGGFEIDFLMLVAALGSAILGNWAEGALLLFLFSLGHALEHFAMEKARKSIAALTELAPKTALLKVDGHTSEVNIDSLQPGNVIIVRPHTRVAADGIVIGGNSSVNQAPITGESIPVDKEAFHDASVTPEMAAKLEDRFKVFAGTINGNELLEIRVTRNSGDSTLARLVRMVNEAQTQKSPTQQFADKLEKYYVPIILILVVVLCFAFLVVNEPFSASFYRAMAVLVAASPCALAISTPSAVLSGVARAARAGVLIKGGKPLEDLGNLSAMAFDKTGTLTEGKPHLTAVVSFNGNGETALLQAAVAVEALSDHPIAKAVVRDGKSKLNGLPVPEATDLEAVLGKGVKASWQGDNVYMGNLALFESMDGIHPSSEVVSTVRELEQQGNTTMLLRKNDRYDGVLAVMDTPRPEAKNALAELRKAGIKKMVMLSGDNQQVAEAVGKEIGITQVMGSLLPEQKVAAVRQLKDELKAVAMVGDGVNDAPAMANSTVGIAMGAAGSQVALETADIALMGDKLSLLPFAIGLSRKASRIIKQNLVISMGMVVILIPLTLSGIASLGPAVLGHEGSTLVVVLNALRLLAYKQESV
ncbi:heavy metal translocating P-type ATPase [Flavihumibacter petaseus]|uniref:P-type Zn(2+) transporter n=1 Tax=Flavihumibacter petaseus NBRC 106054 TaxID=1220578 RepID=A0A0E9MZU9_9BACT|nr:heavy metal translocating P-type ATPase [Flavihumibacter petaseus]GAO42655.1 putative heavy metal-transporting P-type ATPase [Flavihumibacter petaseus NBRC 106054]